MRTHKTHSSHTVRTRSTHSTHTVRTHNTHVRTHAYAPGTFMLSPLFVFEVGRFFSFLIFCFLRVRNLVDKKKTNMKENFSFFGTEKFVQVVLKTRVVFRQNEWYCKDHMDFTKTVVVLCVVIILFRLLVSFYLPFRERKSAVCKQFPTHHCLRIRVSISIH